MIDMTMGIIFDEQLRMGVLLVNAYTIIICR